MSLEEVYESAKLLLQNIFIKSNGLISCDQCGYCGLWKDSIEMDYCDSGHNGDLFCKNECIHKCTRCNKTFCMKCLELAGIYEPNNGLYFPNLEKQYECPNCY